MTDDIISIEVAFITEDIVDGRLSMPSLKLLPWLSTLTSKERGALYVRRSRAKVGAILQQLYAEIWRLFPSNGISRCKMDCLEDPYINYGSHQLLLGYQDVEEENTRNLKCGTKTFGLRYENEHHVAMKAKVCCDFSQKHMEFLLVVHRSIMLQYPKYKKVTSQFMRVDLVVGAKTVWHTDTMRGPTPNFMFIEPGHGFQLQVSSFPNFRCSVVTLNGDKYIPHMVRHGHLELIGYKEGKPHFFRCSLDTMRLLKPHGNLDKHIVVGIKHGKLQVIPWKYEIHVKPGDTLPVISMEDILKEADNNRTTSTGRHRYLNGTDKWKVFFGWRNAHRWFPGTEHMCKRIHVFYRPIREETTAARTKTSKETNTPINYTWLNLEEG